MGWLFCYLKVFMSMECTGCKIEKPLSEYYLYKECGQIRPRRRCIECIKAAAAARKKRKAVVEVKIKKPKITPPITEKRKRGRPRKYPIPYQNNSYGVNFEDNTKIVPIPKKEILDPIIVSNEEVAKTKICTKCGIEKHMKQYYANRNVCRRCILTEEKIYRTEKRQEELEEQGGSMRVPTKAGEYTDELQRKNTYEILTLMGWSYNQELNMFYKLPIKDSEGNWFYKNGEPFNKKAKKVYLEYYNTITADKLPKFDKIYHNTTQNLENLNNMIYEFFIDKVDRKTLQQKYNLSENRINYYIRTIYHKIHENATKNK